MKFSILLLSAFLSASANAGLLHAALGGAAGYMAGKSSCPVPVCDTTQLTQCLVDRGVAQAEIGRLKDRIKELESKLKTKR